MADNDFTSDIRSSPYLGTYNTRPVIVQAPDAIVYINEEHTIPICLECDAKVPIKDYITAVSSSLSTEGSGGGTANIDITVPRHANVTFIRDGKSALANMMEVEIWYKGAFTVNGLSRYYRGFWGYINNISEDYSDGNHSISLSCVDMLSYWNVIKFNVNASLVASRVSGQRSIITAWGTRFQKANPFQILARLSLISRADFVEARSFFNDAVQSEAARTLWRQSTDQLIKFWQERFNKIARAIRIYGVDGSSIFDGGVFYNGDKATQRQLSRKLVNVDAQTLFGLKISTNDRLFSPFVTLGNIELFASELRGRLDIMVQVRDHIGWEFFMDPSGEIVFKPPFYNVDVKQNFPISWIRDIDVLNWNFTESEPEATRVDVVGHMVGSHQHDSVAVEVEKNGVYQDFHLSRQYGIRQENIQAHWLRTGFACGMYAVDTMAKHAANRFQGMVTIPGRPELRLGLPVYIESMDTYYYVTSIQHSLAFGSSFTTTLGLTAKRSRFTSTELIPENGRFVNDVRIAIDKSGINRDTDGRNVGIPNIIMRQATREEYKTLREAGDPMVVGAPSETTGEPITPDRAGGYHDIADDLVQQQLEWDDLRRGITWNVSGGLWVYDFDEEQNVIAVTYNPSDTESPNYHQPVHRAAIPVSDGYGYELIGAFSYGRGLIIDETGALVSPTGTVDDEGNPVPTTTTVAQRIEAAIELRNSAPDDLVEAIDGEQTRASAGGGVLSEASVLKVDQTNAGKTFAEMAPEEEDVTYCTCTDNYTLDNLLIAGVGGPVVDVFERITAFDDLFEDSYQVTAAEVSKHAGIQRQTQQVRAKDTALTSPSIPDAERILNRGGGS